MGKRLRRESRERMLTEVELEMMHVLWRLGGGTVNDVLGALPASRKLAYTSVSTILRILEQKEFLISSKQGRGHRYVPTLTKTEYESKSVNYLVKRIFHGTSSDLVKRLLDEGDMNSSELRQIRDLLDQRLS